MAGYVIGISRGLHNLNYYCVKTLLKQQTILVNIFQYAKSNSFFRYFAEKSNFNENYEYEVTNDSKEWMYVERLMPFVTVPIPTPKEKYPSGWRPMKEESLQLPYFIERTKNHMLPIYLNSKDRGETKITVISKIHGDLLGLHDELKNYIETSKRKKVASYIHEGNNIIWFKGDHVYESEQWALQKGF